MPPKNKFPIVTAVLPCYNHGLWVQDALNSIINQTYKNLRIVFIDDASTDDSFEKALELCNNLQDVQIKNNGEPRLLKQSRIQNFPIILAKFSENRGPSAARNYGIRTAWEDTDYFALLDTDDMYSDSNKISKSINIFNEFENLIGVIYSDYITVNKITNLECREFKQPYSRQLLLKECIVNCNSVVSKNVFEKCGLFDETISLCEDFDMWLRASEKFIFYHIPEALIKIRVGGNSTSIVRSKEDWEKNYSYIFNKLKNRVEHG